MERKVTDCILRIKVCKNKNLPKQERTNKGKNEFIGMRWQEGFLNNLINFTFGLLNTVAKDGTTISIHQLKEANGMMLKIMRWLNL